MYFESMKKGGIKAKKTIRPVIEHKDKHTDEVRYVVFANKFNEAKAVKTRGGNN